MQGQTNQVSNHSKRQNYYCYSKNLNYGNQLTSAVGQQWPIHLPTGWKREECVRPNGLGTGKSDIYYISPQGQHVRTKQEMQVILGENYDLASFDWRAGKFVLNGHKMKRTEELSDGPNNKISKVDNLSFPTRRSSPPLDMKPIIVRSHPECKRTDVKNGNQETPHQLFWEKRLANNVAINSETGEPFKPLNLPKGLQSAGVPGYHPTQLIQSLVYAMSSKTSPITGQEQPPTAIEKNPCVAVNHLQPMIKTFIVTDEDIKRQEARVKELRKKLEAARKKLHPRYFSEREG